MDNDPVVLKEEPTVGDSDHSEIGKECALLKTVAKVLSINQNLGNTGTAPKSASHLINVKIGGFSIVNVLIDSGAEINAISETDWATISTDYEDDKTTLYEINIRPISNAYPYASESPLRVHATFSAWTRLSDHESVPRFATFHVVAGARRSLISRELSYELKVLSVGFQINSIDVAPFPSIPDFEAVLDVDPEVIPTKNAYYSVPAAYEKEARERLELMEKQDIIERVYDSPRWISGMSAVNKDHSKDFRLVVNMKGPNRAILRPFHRLPVIEELKQKLHGARVFTKLDLTSAYFHIRLAPESRELTTFMADTGMFRYKRLNFGVNSAPEIFQRTMEKIFQGISGVIIFIDDILIYASCLEELKERSEQVLQRVRANNLTLNESKCEYDQEEVIFLGHKLSSKGFAIEDAKIESVKNFREPLNVSELKSFLGLASHLSNYIDDFGNLTAPLWAATKKDGFVWQQEQREAFERTKQSIINCTTKLGFFSNDDTTILYTDASPHAVGAVLTQINAEGHGRIISFASKALSPTEKRYPQTQREALAIVWAIEHFYYYLMGRHFVVRTDAQGVAFIYKREREVYRRIMTRADGWALRLNAFDFSIEFIKGRFNIADPSSRLYQGIDDEYKESGSAGGVDRQIDAIAPTRNEVLSTDPAVLRHELNMITFLDENITLENVIEETSRDATFSEAINFIRSGKWPVKCKHMPDELGDLLSNNDALKQLWSVRESLRIDSDMLTRNGAIVLPPSLRSKAMNLAHSGHPGISSMKSILRSRVWWPHIKEDVETFVGNCTSCSLMSRKEKPAPMRRSVLPQETWECLAVDFNGPHQYMGGKSIFLIVDYYSRFLTASIVQSTDFKSVKPVLELLFERYGKPKSIRSDNGPPFNGGNHEESYKSFLKKQGITAEFSTPHYPQQNGMIERYMQTVNKAIQIARLEGTHYEEALSAAIRAHNRARHRVTQQIPEELMWGRKIRRELPLLGDAKSSINRELLEKRDYDEKLRAKVHEDMKRGAKLPEIALGDSVRILKIKRKKGDPKYDPEEYKVVSRDHGDYLLASQDGKLLSRNITHLKKAFPNADEALTNEEGDQDGEGIILSQQQGLNPQRRTRIVQPSTPTRPVRIRNPPAHLADYIRMLTLN